ncbi:MAG TPA: hypothetical protein PKA13_10025 [Geminicoccaceae bacterium]|nr:hypothetical protein [Geminicoccus sp.]HMU50104.1 hypothetical protein [Geminicoccaceae bacterium]
MDKNVYALTTKAVLVFSTTLATVLLGTAPGRAGMTDQATGDHCVGTGCMEGGDDLPIQTNTNTGPPPVYLPSNVTTEDCSSADSRRIGAAVTWLENNIPAITAKMAESSYLMSWPGNTREKFEEKLDKKLEFHCINQKDKCDHLLGKVVPVFAQQRINLCSTNINASGDGDAVKTGSLYAHVIAHEIGHLIRINSHTGGCVSRFTDGSFSDALGFAAEYAFRGETYDPKAYAGGCPGLDPQPFSWEDKLNNMEKPIQAQK